MISHANRKPITLLTMNTTLTAAISTLNATPTAAVRDGAHGMGQVADAVDGDRNPHGAEHDEKPRRQRRHDVVDDEPGCVRGQTARRRAVAPRPARDAAAAVVNADASAEPPNVSRRHQRARRDSGERGHDRQRVHNRARREAVQRRSAGSSHLLHHTMSTRLKTRAIT